MAVTSHILVATDLPNMSILIIANSTDETLFECVFAFDNGSPYLTRVISQVGIEDICVREINAFQKPSTQSVGILEKAPSLSGQQGLAK